jgi:GNAT superfamily N-acetyltransferase
MTASRLAVAVAGHGVPLVYVVAEWTDRRNTAMAGEIVETAGFAARPTSVTLYERIAIAALVATAASAWADRATLVKYYNQSPVLYPIVVVGMLAVQAAWIWLVARKRKNWARWISIIFAIASLPSVLLEFRGAVSVQSDHGRDFVHCSHHFGHCCLDASPSGRARLVFCYASFVVVSIALVMAKDAMIVVGRVGDQLPAGFEELEADAIADGHTHLSRLSSEFVKSPTMFHQIFAALVGSTLAGIGAITDEPASTRQPTWRMRRLYVHRNFRRRGVANAIADALLRVAAREVGRVTVHAGSDEAARFWELMGFDRVEGQSWSHEKILKQHGGHVVRAT